ncbi:MAG: GNAT family N-acetyltransferase [Candidatus Thermoplasmatota archaeon]|nr:GNAT family N-acetyltransferase [Candidatus Thermoplasmatota archaeon]
MKNADIVDFRSVDRKKLMNFLMDQMPKSVYLLGDLESNGTNFTMFTALDNGEIRGVVCYFWGIPGTGIIWILGNEKTVAKFIDGLENETFVILIPVSSERKIRERFRNIISYQEYIMECTKTDSDARTENCRILGIDDVDQWGFLKTERTNFSREEKDQFVKNLKDQTCFGMFENGSLVSGAVIEAETRDMVVIGSVKTLSNHRNRGYATSLVGHIMHHYLEIGKKGYLFVRKDNIPAIRAYVKAGFTIVDEILISYNGIKP